MDNNIRFILYLIFDFHYAKYSFIMQEKRSEIHLVKKTKFHE